MKNFFGFLLVIITMAVFPSLLPAAQQAAQQEDIFGGLEAVIAGAEAGDVEAQMALAQRYRFGVGVPLDPARAVEWFQKAAEQGNVQGEFSVGYMYATGENGFERNPAKAAEWFRKAAENGHPGAQINLANMYAAGEGLTQNAGRATTLYQEAGEDGNAAAQFALALRYINGDGVARDIKKAIELYQKAAENGHPGAQINLANIYADGELTRKNLAAAADLYLKAAERGIDLAQHSIGLMYYNGNGVKKDRAAALQWFQKAANQRHPFAQEDLGHMYLKGEGVKKDEIEGLAWLYLADGNRPVVFPDASDEIAKLEKRLGVEKTQAARRRSGELRQAINLEIYARTGIPAPEPIGHPIGIGAGAVISRDGLVITAARIVAGAESIKVKTPLSARTFTAKILEINRDNDLAILKFEGSVTPLLVTGSGHISIDQDVFAIISPRPVEDYRGAAFYPIKVQKLTGARNDPAYIQVAGNSIAPGLQMPEAVRRKIQTDSAVRILNSASGPLVDVSGNLIGMISYRAMSEEGFVYVLRSEALRPLLEKYGVKFVEYSGNGPGKFDRKDPAPMRWPSSIVMILTY